jgi:hypothetical protein
MQAPRETKTDRRSTRVAEPFRSVFKALTEAENAKCDRANSHFNPNVAVDTTTHPFDFAIPEK